MSRPNQEIRFLLISWVAGALAFAVAAQALWPNGINTAGISWGFLAWACVAFASSSYLFYWRLMRWLQRWHVRNRLSESRAVYVFMGALSYVVPMWATFALFGFGIAAPLMMTDSVQPFGIAFIIAGAVYGVVFGWQSRESKPMSPPA